MGLIIPKSHHQVIHMCTMTTVPTRLYIIIAHLCIRSPHTPGELWIQHVLLVGVLGQAPAN